MKEILNNNHHGSQVQRQKRHNAAKAHKEYLKTVAVSNSMKKHTSSKNIVDHKNASLRKETILYRPIKRTFFTLNQHGVLLNSQCYKYFSGDPYLKVLGSTNNLSKAGYSFKALAFMPSTKSAKDAVYFKKDKKDTIYLYNRTSEQSIKHYLKSVGIKVDLQHYWYRLFATYSILINGKKSLLVDLNPGFRQIQKFSK